MTSARLCLGLSQSQSPRIGAVIRINPEIFCEPVVECSLNPLESGQSFESKRHRAEGPYAGPVSIPSNRGNHSNRHTPGRWPLSACCVSIPSNRGNHSNHESSLLQQVLQSLSQSPRIGAIIRIMLWLKKSKNLKSLNPLESGQSFE